jgi:hypothetical protein
LGPAQLRLIEPNDASSVLDQLPVAALVGQTVSSRKMLLQEWMD